MASGVQGDTRRLVLLGGFTYLRGGEPVPLPPAAQHLLAYLGVQRRSVPRPLVAATLWPGADERRAGANLRAVLWRMPEAHRDTVVSGAGTVGLDPGVSCDVSDMTAQAHRLIDGAAAPAPSDLAIEPLLDDLLPAWYEDWVLAERERLTQLRMHALEALCTTLTALGRFAEAIDAGLAAVAAEPLRETAHRRLIEAHLAEGNVNEALRQYGQYEDLLAEGLGAAPSADLRGLVEAAIRR